ncbi:MAG: hypothetical protein ABI550_02100 [Ignavibacteriaceae bacterium]
MSLENLSKECLYNWLGYGKINSPIWFIGTEEGGAEIWRKKTKTLEESLRIRQSFNLSMDFVEVWEKKYNIKLSSFKGANVWRYIAAFILSINNQDITKENIYNFINVEKKLGRSDSDHFLCELLPLPKERKNSISPYEDWSSLKKYHDEVMPKRFELIKKSIEKNSKIKLIISYEKELAKIIEENLSTKKVKDWKANEGKENYTLYEVSLSDERKLFLLSTPFFGNGRISYRGINESVKNLKKLNIVNSNGIKL